MTRIISIRIPKKLQFSFLNFSVNSSRPTLLDKKSLIICCLGFVYLWSQNDIDPYLLMKFLIYYFQNNHFRRNNFSFFFFKNSSDKMLLLP